MEKKKENPASKGARDQAESKGAAKPDAEATSSETLSDVEENEKVSGSSGSDSGGGALEGSSPKPSSEGGGRADGSDTGGPM